MSYFHPPPPPIRRRPACLRLTLTAHGGLILLNPARVESAQPFQYAPDQPVGAAVTIARTAPGCTTIYYVKESLEQIEELWNETRTE